MSYFLGSFILIVQMLVSIYIYMLLLRFILQKLRANYFNQVIQVLVKLTDPVVKPLRRILPSVKGYDLAIVLIVIILQLLIILLVAFVGLQAWTSILGFFLILIGELGKKVIYIYFAAIIAGALASWFRNLSFSPAFEVVHLICEPIMARVRRVIPPLAGIDFSPMVVIVGLYIINSVVFYPLIYYGYSLR